MRYNAVLHKSYAVFLRWRFWFVAVFGAVYLSIMPAQAENAVSCGGAAMQGGAQLMCSQTKPHALTQLCTFSWALMTETQTSQIVEGSFLLAPGASNMQVYQGSGFVSQLTPPIILCNTPK